MIKENARGRKNVNKLDIRKQHYLILLIKTAGPGGSIMLPHIKMHTGFPVTAVFNITHQEAGMLVIHS